MSIAVWTIVAVVALPVVWYAANRIGKNRLVLKHGRRRSPTTPTTFKTLRNYSATRIAVNHVHFAAEFVEV